MTKLIFIFVIALSVAGCSRGDSLEIPAGSEVTVEKTDGVTVTGRLVEVRAEQVIIENPAGGRTNVRRADIRTIAAAPVQRTDAVATTGEAAAARDTPAPPAVRDTPAVDPKPEPRSALARTIDRKPEYREVTLPAGTVLPVSLQTAVASDTSSPEDPVRGILRRPVSIDGVQVLPQGTAVLGHVTSATRSAKVKGRASVAFRFNRIDLPENERAALSSGTITRVAAATKKEDAAKIGGGAAGGAIIGGLIGGGDGAAKGAAIGGAAGTGVVLSTRGKEVRLGPGLALSVRLTAPLVVRVPVE